MADIDVKSAVHLLGKLLLEELRYLDSVRGKVGELESELSVLAALLEDAVEKYSQQDKAMRTMLSQARDIAYDCEDVIETYMLTVAHHEYEEREGCQLGTIMRWACLFANNPIPLHQIGLDIDNLNKRISSLRTRMRDYGVQPKDRPAERDDPFPELTRIHTHDREEYDVVGVQHHLDHLVDRLLNPAYSDQTVIAISGMGGIGKSTLAIGLYHHDEVRRHFKEFALVHLSQQFQTDRILQQLLYKLVPPENEQRRRAIKEDIKAGRAHGALYEVMKDFKCLVVIDDIWTSNDWAKLQAAFPRRTTIGSRILLTTRNIGTISGLDKDMVYLHPVMGLNDDDSWELFEKTAFPGATCTDPKKEELGQEMLRHCRGVPLAIIVLGKVLKAKGSVNEWNQMRDNISTQIRRGGAPNEPYGKVYDVLQVSYDELQPSYLKYCFLHLANFPEDWEIPAEKLFQLWVNEGIILKEYPHELEEDAAERCLNELVSRNMVQVASRELSTGRIETCQLHDLMRDICIEIAKREGFLQVINCQKSMLLTNHKNGDRLLMTSLPERDKRLRRLAVYVTNQGLQSSTFSPATPVSISTKVSRAPNLRSLSLFSVAEQQSEADDKRFVEAICKDFPLLRVFDCENFLLVGKLSKKIGNLIHLRYLSLANTYITELPSSIDKLLLLQTLDLRVNEDMVISLPNLLWKMKQLRHLYLPYYGGLELNHRGIGEHAPQRYLTEGGELLLLHGLQNLQTILHLDLDRVNLQGVSKLLSMKTLSATCVTKEALCPFLQSSSMKKASLRIHAQIINKDPMILSSCEAINHLDIHAQPYVGFALTRPLCLEMFPKSLVRLGIWYLQLGTDPLPILEKLPNLVALVLRMCYPGSRMVCTAGGFPELTELIFHGLSSFSDWEVEGGALSKLTHLDIIKCPITKVPDALSSSVNATNSANW